MNRVVFLIGTSKLMEIGGEGKKTRRGFGGDVEIIRKIVNGMLEHSRSHSFRLNKLIVRLFCRSRSCVCVFCLPPPFNLLLSSLSLAGGNEREFVFIISQFTFLSLSPCHLHTREWR